jgi:hypothetical protein
MKGKVRLSESQLHRIIKESVNAILREYIEVSDRDVEDFRPSDEFTRKEFNRINSKYAKMPKGYDKNLDPHRDWLEIDALTNNKGGNYESELYPYLKHAQEEASWDKYDKYNRPWDDGFDRDAYERRANKEGNGLSKSLGDLENYNIYDY